MLYDPKDELNRLPEQPGVYFMRDGGGAVIYVGKAKNIKYRVRSYFQESNLHYSKILGIRTNMKSLEYIVAESEYEAFILECNLIKEHRPRYNVKMKDDRAYPYIKVTSGEPFPRAYVERTCEVFSGGQYFGPYVDVMSVRAVVEMLHRVWPLRRCKKPITETIEGEVPRPCLFHHIGQCKAPCAGLISKSEYAFMAQEFMDFLKGKHQDIIAMLNKEMIEASEDMQFERAAALRDKIRSVKTLRGRQIVSIVNRGDTDIIAYAVNGDEALAQLFYMREGKIIGREHHLMEGIAESGPGEIMSAIITQFYNGTPFVPKEIVVQAEPSDCGIITEWLSKMKGGKVSLFVPQKGEKAKMVEMAFKNAELQLKQFGEQIKKEVQRTTGAVLEIMEALKLTGGFGGLSGSQAGEISAETVRIEAYDISNTSGVNAVASMVVFELGKPKRNDYRKFKIRTVKGANDYAMMEEVLTRRFKRYETEKGETREDKKKFSRLPDIIFVDGGKPQVSAAEGVLEKLGFAIPVCGMIKDDKHRTRGLLYRNDEAVLPKHTEGFKLLTRIQDEVHRFAIEYHKNLRLKAGVRSALDDIKGIGAKRRVSLVKHFGSLEKIREATPEQLQAADGMNVTAAAAVWDYFQKKRTEGDCGANPQ
jgi:excinuclease ABC subunit C